MSKWTLREQGESNQYCILDEDGKWVVGLIANGELHVHNQQVLMRRIVASVNACNAISLADLEGDSATFLKSLLEQQQMQLQLAKEKEHNLELTQLLLRTQAFIRRVQIYEEGKPDKHDTMEDIRAALKGVI